MRPLITLALILSITACSKPSNNEVLVQTFWDAVIKQDITAIRGLIKDPENSKYFSAENNFTLGLMGDSFKVLTENDNSSVSVNFSRFCYPDRVLPTVLAEVDGSSKVDIRATFFAATRDLTPLLATEKYCYKFDEKPMAGLLNGNNWSAYYIDKSVVSFPSGDQVKASIYSESCPADSSCWSVKTSSLNISNLDLSGTGGNFDHKNNITIFTPPNKNILITEGSYRVSQLSDGQTKLELSFNQDSENQIKGYFLY